MLPRSLQRHKTGSSIIFTIFTCFFLYYAFFSDPHPEEKVPARQKPAPANPFCEARYGKGYLQGFQQRHAEYCTDDSTSKLECFSNKVDADGRRTDSFCLAQSASPTSDSKQFSLDCQLRQLGQEEVSNGIQPFHSFPAYWYETGPRYLFNNFVKLNRDEAVPTQSNTATLPTIILLKREHSNFNLWHSLMEIISISYSLQILSSTTNTKTGHPYHTIDPSNTHLLLLDSLQPGPYLPLYSLFTTNPLLHISSSPTLPQHSNLLLPLPGGSNPHWQADWTPLNCTSAPLLQSFTTSLLTRFSIPTPPSHPSPTHLTLTFLLRTTKRRLLSQRALLSSLNTHLPLHTTLLAIDFATLPIAEQIRHATQTDILIGVHGAGLTHSMFLPPKSGVVEFMPYKIDHKGFTNLAKMLGFGYWRADTVALPEGREVVEEDDGEGEKKKVVNTGDWQEDDVWVNEEVFVRTVLEAVEGVRRMRQGKVL